MFDLTKEIQIESQMLKKYFVARIFLYIFFLIIVLFTLDRIFFPSLSFALSFSNINSPKNTLNLSRATLQSDTMTKGLAGPNDILAFDTNPLGNFSNATVKFTTSDNKQNIENTSVKIRKSYEAFFYPTGNPIGFNDGTLLLVNDSYYIVSDGTLRKFSNFSIVTQLGFSKNSFIDASQNDLKYNKAGDDIVDATVYPDDTLFIIGDTYYQLKNQQLAPFVSTNAFLSQFDANQAITKNDDFLSQYKLSETSLGFADGTLASLAPSVFILSEGKSYPISNADTFVRMGFDWNNVTPINSEELEIYEKQKQFTYNQPHPDGTLFMDQKTNKYFIIGNGEKHPIESATIAKTYAEQNSVLVDIQTSEVSVSCQLEKAFLSNSKYVCDIPINSLNNFIGNTFQFNVRFANNIKITNIGTVFFTSLDWENFRLALSKIKGGLITNYTQ